MLTFCSSNIEPAFPRYVSALQVDEMPYLLAEAGEMKKLRAIVLNVAVFSRLMSTDEGKFQLIKSWQLVSKRSK